MRYRNHTIFGLLALALLLAGLHSRAEELPPCDTRGPVPAWRIVTPDGTIYAADTFTIDHATREVRWEPAACVFADGYEGEQP